MKIKVLGSVEKKWAGELAWRVRSFKTMKLHVRGIVRDRQAAFVGSQSMRKLELDRAARSRADHQRSAHRRAALPRVFDADWKANRG